MTSASAQRSSTSDQKNILHRHLPNGMEVFLHEQHFSPVCTIYICVKAGSMDETETEQGMAHVLEHMLFKGTKNYPEPGQLANRVESAGGDINAYTTFDRTVYELSAPSHFVLEGANLLLDMVSQATLDAEEHKRETEVIVEEIRRGNDNPGSRLSKALFGHAYAGTEMGRPIIGTTESVRSFDRKGIHNFYSRWYLPNNMIFVASGDFNAEALYNHIQNQTADFRPGTVPQRVRPNVQVIGLKGNEPPFSVISGPYQEVRLQLGVRAPALEDEALARWDTFTSLLGQGDSSRLAQVVKDQKQLATGADSGVYSPAYPAGLATIGLYARGEDVLSALEASLQVAARLAAEEPAEIEVRRVHTTLKAERIYARETVEGVVRQSLSGLLTTKGTQFEEHYLQLLSKVTPKSVQTTAQEFISKIRSGECTISAVTAEEYATVITPASLAATVQRALASKDNRVNAGVSAQSLARSALNPDVKQTVLHLSNGYRINVNYRQTDKIPAVAFGIYARGGQVSESGFAPGSASLLAQMLTRGTEDLSYRDFVADLENRAASIQAFQGKDVFGVRADALSEDFEHVLGMSLDVLFRPAFHEAEFKRVKRESIDVVRAQKDNPGSRLGRLAGPLFYGSHSYATPLAGTEDSMASIMLHEAPHSLTALWRRELGCKEWTFAIAGDFDEDALRATLLDQFERATANLDERLAEMPEAPQQSALSKANVVGNPQLAFEPFDREQAHIILGFRGATMQDESRMVFEIAAAILSGQGGRLFADLREKRSLAYSVSASQSLGMLGGHFLTYIGTAADKTKTALHGLKEHIEALAKNAPTDAEVSRAQQSLLGSQSLESQQLSYQCAQLAYSDVYGFGFEHFLRFRERVLAVTADRIRKTFAETLKASPPVVVIIGPTETWRPEAGSLRWDI
jgi:zinc protease